MLVHPRSRRRALLAVLIAGVVVTLALMGWLLFAIGGFLGLIPVSERSLVGTYVVHYRTRDLRPAGAGNDTLILKPDHTFVQICLPEKGKRIEMRVDLGPFKKYNRVRMVGTWHVFPEIYGGNYLGIEGALDVPQRIEEAPGPPQTGTVADNTYIREAPCTLELPIEWQIGGPVIVVDDDNDVYFRKVK